MFRETALGITLAASLACLEQRHAEAAASEASLRQSYLDGEDRQRALPVDDDDHHHQHFASPSTLGTNTSTAVPPPPSTTAPFLTERQKQLVWRAFDLAMSETLASQAEPKVVLSKENQLPSVTVEADTSPEAVLPSYRYVDGRWTVLLTNPTVRIRYPAPIPVSVPCEIETPSAATQTTAAGTDTITTTTPSPSAANPGSVPTTTTTAMRTVMKTHESFRVKRLRVEAMDPNGEGATGAGKRKRVA